MTRSVVKRTHHDTYQITCQQCGNHTELGHHQLPRRRRKLTITCDCGHVFKVVCDRRREARQPLHIEGYLFASGTKEPRGDITIIDLSISGLRFVSTRPDIEVDNSFTVGFFLDDASAAWIEQDIVVRGIQASQLVRAEFANPDLYSVDLDFYLMTFSLAD